MFSNCCEGKAQIQVPATHNLAKDSLDTMSGCDDLDFAVSAEDVGTTTDQVALVDETDLERNMDPVTIGPYTA